MVAAFKANNIENVIAKSDTDSVKLESEELFPDQEDELDKMEEGASSDIIDTCEEDQEAIVGWKH